MKVVLPGRLKPIVSRLPSDPEIAWYSDNTSCLAALPGAEIFWIDFAVKDIAKALEAGSDLKWLTSQGTGVDGWPLALSAGSWQDYY